MSKLMMGVAIASLMAVAPALAQDSWKDKQKEQLLYQEQLKMQDQQGQALPDEQGAIGATKPNSGPGVQGPPDTRTGPATKAPGGSADADANASGSANSGASSGEAGAINSGSATTQPSQDSSGVQGFPDTRTGPATNQPDDMGMVGKDQFTDDMGEAEPGMKSTEPAQKTAEPKPQTSGGVDFVVTEEAKKEWIGKSVYSSDGSDLGDVADLKTGPDNKLTEFDADIGGFLGLGMTRVSVDANKIQEVKDDRIVLNLKKADAQGLPRVADEAKPSEQK